jgi:hypothetical protein
MINPNLPSMLDSQVQGGEQSRDPLLPLSGFVTSQCPLLITTTPRAHQDQAFHIYCCVGGSVRMAFDLDACIAQLLQKQLLGEALLREICEKTKELLMRESNVVHISSPVTVVGDIHGWVMLSKC